MNCHLSLKSDLVSSQCLTRDSRWHVRVLVASSSSTSPTFPPNIASAPSTTAATAAAAASSSGLFLVWCPNIKPGDVDQPVLPATLSAMFSELVCLQIHVRIEDDKLLLHALPIRTQVVALLEMLLKSVVVPVVMRLPRVPPVTEETPLVLHATMLVQLIVIVEALPAESTQRMTLEARLIRRAGLVVAASHVFLEFLVREELVLVCEDSFVPRAQVAHALLVGTLDVSVQIRPAETGEIAVAIGAVVSKEQDGIAHDVLLGVFDADVGVGSCEVGVGELLESFRRVCCEDDEGSRCL